MRKLNRGVQGQRLRRNPLVHAVAVGGIFLGTLGGATLVVTGSASAVSVAKTALINADTVTTNDGITDAAHHPISLEAYAAAQAGYKVTVVTGAQWDAMTAAQFAKYQLLIVGDPHCGSVAASVTSNYKVWTSVVMGKAGGSPVAGNRIVIGTDPEDHYAYGGGGAPPKVAGNPLTAGAEHLVQGGITYAGLVTGATGVYFDSTCSGSPSDPAILNALSVKATGFTEVSPGCISTVSILASNPSFAKLTDPDLGGWGCSVHRTYPTYPADWQPLAIGTFTPTTPTCGIDVTTKAKACGQAYVLVAGTGLVSGAPDLHLLPVTGKGTVGSPYKITATIAVAKVAKSGIPISFTLSGVNAGIVGACAPASCRTNAAGQVSFTYVGRKLGIDSVAASATINLFLERAIASVTWIAAPVDQYFLLGLTKDAHGIYQVKYGHIYTFVAMIGGKVAPRYYYATRAYTNWVGRPWQPGDRFVNRGGGRFTMELSITPFGMLLHPNWNIGALDGAGNMHILHIHVS